MKRFSASNNFIERHTESSGNCMLFADHEQAVAAEREAIAEMIYGIDKVAGPLLAEAIRSRGDK